MAQRLNPATARGYTIAQLRRLMLHAGATSVSWQELIEFLQGSPGATLELEEPQMQAMVGDLYLLQRAGLRYHADYRWVWRRLTGEEVDELPATASLRRPDALEMQRDYFGDLAFPATKKAVLRAARINKAPARVMDRVEDLERMQFGNREELIEALRDAGGNAA